MTVEVDIQKGAYHDSVRLMQISQQLRSLPGMREAILMMATDNNKRILAAAGFGGPQVDTAARDDLVIGLAADNDQAVAAARQLADTLLRQRAKSEGRREYRSLEAARAELPEANIALISVPGEYAADEARKALGAGLNVMLFSDNVALADEIALKSLAADNGLLLMGPDCGTAVINGCGLGFANAVRQGDIGIIGASGTGIQEILAQIDRLGGGVSHAIGVGGRDLKPEVGGMAMLQALQMLAVDAATKVIVLTSKPPHAKVAQLVLESARRCGKPVVVNFLGADSNALEAPNLHFATTLADTAHAAMQLSSSPSKTVAMADIDGTDELAALAPEQRYLRGLFSGGTLCYEAMLLLRPIGRIFANIALDPQDQLPDPNHSQQHSLLDMGEDFFTQGRPHPMLDPQLRNDRLLQEAADPNVAIILLDLVLGHGAHPDPADTLSRTIRQAKRIAKDGGRHLIVIASVCGTQADPQDYDRQCALMIDAGARIAPSNAQAAMLARDMLQTLSAKQEQSR
ncbi:MAG: acyl-CoA synthetase FdrA [Sphingomonadales bacterium]